VTGAPIGFAGPVGLTIPIYADQKLKGYKGSITGANQADAHWIHVDLERDAVVTKFMDITFSKDGDGCLRCGTGMLNERRGIEVGHVFKLGTKYSEKLGALFKDADGKERPAIMGCYGIGVTRTLQAVIEQNFDAEGIIWPITIAPYAVEVVVINVQSAESVRVGEQIVADLEAVGMDVLYDDRDERPGVKFKDADLLGIPVRVNVGEKSLAKGMIEVKLRKTKEMRPVPVAEASKAVFDVVRALTDEING
jgi:prolyl-tRNA synthetase